MNAAILITTKGRSLPVDEALYRHIFESSIVSDHTEYLRSLELKKISFSTLVSLCRHGRIAYTLFFGSMDVVAPVIDEETEKVFGGFDGLYSVGVRGRTFNLNVIRLLIKDMKMKQDVITRFVKAGRNPHVKRLKNSRLPIQEQSDFITSSLGLNMDIFRSFKDKRDALNYLISNLEENHIFVSIENTGTNMPQNLKRAAGVSGVYVRHNKFPYIFLSIEGVADPDKTPARKIFTLMYLIVCLFKGQSRMVSLNQSLTQSDDLFLLTETILMPKKLLPILKVYSLDNLDGLGGLLNVSPSAILTRLRKIDYMSKTNYDSLYAALRARYEHFFSQERKKAESQKSHFSHNIVRNIHVYQGKAFLRILKSQYIAGNIGRKEINRQLSYGKKGGVDVEKVFDTV